MTSLVSAQENNLHLRTLAIIKRIVAFGQNFIHISLSSFIEGKRLEQQSYDYMQKIYQQLVNILQTSEHCHTTNLQISNEDGQVMRTQRFVRQFWQT